MRLSFPGLLLVAACIPPPPDLCRRGVDLECTRQFECRSPEVKATAAFVAGYGSTVAQCRSKLEALAGCDDKLTESDLCTGEDIGKQFDVGAASQCSNERKAQSCEDFLDPGKQPASCATRCHGS